MKYQNDVQRHILKYHSIRNMRISMHVCVCAQSCLILCDSMYCSPSSSSVHGIFQARILEWVVISNSRASSQPRDRTCNSCVICIGRQILYHCAVEIFGLPRWLSGKRIHLPMQEIQYVQSLGQEDPLEEMATHSSIPAWRIPWTEEPGGL